MPPPPHTASMDGGIIAIFTVTVIDDYGIRNKMAGTLGRCKYLVSSEPWCIEIKNNSEPDSSKGITFGWGKNCGVQLPKHDSISKCHFRINFDNENRLVIIDHSTNGIEVKYGEQGAGWRKQTQCILNDPKLPPNLRQIKINVAHVMTFAVDVRLMLSSEESYTDVVDDFRKRCNKKGQDLALGFQWATLHQTRQMLSSDQVSDIWLRWEVPTKGTSASITRCWNSEDGTESIVKAPSSTYDKAKWSRQVKLMTILKDHHHVVDILSTSEGIQTYIEMECVSGGSLEEPGDPSQVSVDSSDRSDAGSEYSTEGSDIFAEHSYSEFSKEEVMSVLAQCLSVLAKMHKESPPIWHRDLTGSNILIHRRDSSGICVKVAGFGAAITKPETGKGGDGVGYAPFDIWSLGLTVLGLINKEARRHFHISYRELWTELDKSEDSLVQFVRRNMLQEDRRKTESAAECLTRLRAEADIKTCGCKCNSCGGKIAEGEHEGAERPTTPDVQETSSDCPTPRPKTLADGQSEDSANTPEPTRTPTPAPATAQLQAAHGSPTPGGSATSMLPTQPDVGDSATALLFAALLEHSSANAGEQVAAPASPADSPTGGEAAAFTDEADAPIKGKRRAESGDEALENKRPKV